MDASGFTVYAVVLRCLKCDSIHQVDGFYATRNDAETRCKVFDDDRENELLAEVMVKTCL